MIGPAHPDERVDVTVRVRPCMPIPEPTLAAATAAGPVSDRKFLTREQFARDYGRIALGHRRGGRIRQSAQFGGRPRQ